MTGDPALVLRDTLLTHRDADAIRAHIQHYIDQRNEARATLDRIRALADQLEAVARDYRHAATGSHDAGAAGAHLAIAAHIRATLDAPPGRAT